MAMSAATARLSTPADKSTSPSTRMSILVSPACTQTSSSSPSAGEEVILSNIEEISSGMTISCDPPPLLFDALSSLV